MSTGAEPASPPPASPPAEPGPPSRPTHVVVPGWLVVVLVAALIFAGGFATGRWAITRDSSSAASAATPGETPSAHDPDQSELSGLVLQQSDVGSNVDVQLLRGGDSVDGQPTLDLCNGTFSSEALRTARLQVVALDSNGNGVLSTEAVLYERTDDSEQAFDELKSVAAKCPKAPVSSPVGEPTVTTRFNAAPDGNWPQTPTVTRLAYSFTTTDQSGKTQSSIAVYLRRGRALMGVYFPQPDGAQIAVHGQTTIAGIVRSFAGRLADLSVTR